MAKARDTILPNVALILSLVLVANMVDGRSLTSKFNSTLSISTKKLKMKDCMCTIVIYPKLKLECCSTKIMRIYTS